MPLTTAGRQLRLPHGQTHVLRIFCLFLLLSLLLVCGRVSRPGGWGGGGDGLRGGLRGGGGGRRGSPLPFVCLCIALCLSFSILRVIALLR